MDAFDTVFGHVEKSGRFAILSSDVGFISLFRHLLQDTFAVGQDRAAAYSNPSVFLSSLSGMNGSQRPPFFVVDRVVAGKESTFAVRSVRRAMPLAPILLVTDDADAKRLIAYLEAGADGVLRKPANAETLLVRMAQVLDPPAPGAKAKRQAGRLIAQGDHRQALQSAWRLLAEHPDCAEAFQVIGDAQLALGNLAQAAEAYLNACRRAKLALEPLGRLAEVYRVSGDNARRLKCLQAMDRLCDLNPDRKVDMGGIHYTLGQQVAAESFFAAAMRITAQELTECASAVLSRIGDVYAESEPAQAEAYYRKSLETKGPRLDAGDMATINRLGLNLRRRGDWRGAVREYKRAQGLDPSQDHVVLYNIAMALAEGQDHDSAAKYAAAALRASPDGFRGNARACYNLAHMFYKVDQRSRALEFAEACLALEPGHGQARSLRDALRVH
ncbi:MAG: tetratricopeptide repeat protein [Thermodesulfobacteriota bacterium]